MITKTPYDVAKLRQALDLIDEFNAMDLAALEFTLDGAPLEYTAPPLNEWKYVGLSNTWYARQFLRGDNGEKV